MAYKMIEIVNDMCEGLRNVILSLYLFIFSTMHPHSYMHGPFKITLVTKNFNLRTSPQLYWMKLVTKIGDSLSFKSTK